jgi:hypothetical protein
MTTLPELLTLKDAAGMLRCSKALVCRIVNGHWQARRRFRRSRSAIESLSAMSRQQKGTPCPDIKTFEGGNE